LKWLFGYITFVKTKVMKERNVIQLIGYVGDEPAVKKFNNGNQVARIRVATHAPVKTEGNEQNPKFSTTWHTVVAWAESAVYAANNFIKGSRIMVDGKLIYRTYLDKTGHTRFITEIIAYSLTNLDR
jgi:single-strand DNA-binding protein